MDASIQFTDQQHKPKADVDQ